MWILSNTSISSYVITSQTFPGRKTTLLFLHTSRWFKWASSYFKFWSQCFLPKSFRDAVAEYLIREVSLDQWFAVCIFRCENLRGLIFLGLVWLCADIVDILRWCLWHFDVLLWSLQVQQKVCRNGLILDWLLLLLAFKSSIVDQVVAEKARLVCCVKLILDRVELAWILPSLFAAVRRIIEVIERNQALCLRPLRLVLSVWAYLALWVY